MVFAQNQNPSPPKKALSPPSAFTIYASLDVLGDLNFNMVSAQNQNPTPTQKVLPHPSIFQESSW